MKRSAAGEYRWALTLFPTHAHASEAGMSLAAYEDFYYRACLADEEDPVAAWKAASEETRRLALEDQLRDLRRLRRHFVRGGRPCAAARRVLRRTRSVSFIMNMQSFAIPTRHVQHVSVHPR